MYSIGKIKISSVIPTEISRLEEISYNLWWSWDKTAEELFIEIDSRLWEEVGGNPVKLLKEVKHSRLKGLIKNPDFMNKYHELVKSYDVYMNSSNTWFTENCPKHAGATVGYFSAEYGITSVLPIYSGGLGVLSGDHLKSSSDLGIPLTAIGLFYKYGYFRQHLNYEGGQETAYTELNTSELPIKPAVDSEGNQLTVYVDFPGRRIYVKIWRVAVGRISLYLLDSDVELNSPADKEITSRLYGGDNETRIQQEIILGVGGYKALGALGINPGVCHMNEGHSAFLSLAILRSLIKEKGLSFEEAKEAAKAMLVFTTHTPVPAGNDMFPSAMIDKYFTPFRDDLNISREALLELGTREGDRHNFNMTVLALRFSGIRNGVSELHGQVTRKIFNDIWNEVPEEEVPVTHITNGIHTPSWIAPDIEQLYDQYLPEGWIQNLQQSDVWSNIKEIPAHKLWTAHCKLKKDLIEFINQRLCRQLNPDNQVSCIGSDSGLDPDALTIGFARRFATYKRADLIFRDLDRIRRIMNKQGRPVQIVYAGKAHPADKPAQEVIKHIIDISRLEGFSGKIIMLENYDISIAKRLVQGVDIWMNNPRRPMEASGTSGQKVCVNGILNFSILDGWWCEGYNGANGWSIGNDEHYTNEHAQDDADSASIYEKLEKEIIPLFFERDNDGTPVQWINKVKESIVTLTPEFSTHRMLADYMNKMYLPSIDRSEKMAADQYQTPIQITKWKKHVDSLWNGVSLKLPDDYSSMKPIESEPGSPVKLTVNTVLGDLMPSDVRVEVYYGEADEHGKIHAAGSQIMELQGQIGQGLYSYVADLNIAEGGEYDYTFRIYPYRSDLTDSFDAGKIEWINNTD